MNSDSIPIDLITEIFTRLPAKSVARFHCVSKLWSSIFVRPYFTELFLTRSSAKPRLLFAITKKDDVWSFFSMPQRHNTYEKSSSLVVVVAAESQLKLPHYNSYRGNFSPGYTFGLICFYGNRYDDNILICNPNTGSYATLPYLKHHGRSPSFFVFDPIEKQYKILLMALLFDINDNKILTLGTEYMWWRTIKCSLRHIIKSEGICINGVLYYLGETLQWLNDGHGGMCYVIVCFAVRSEKFTFIDVGSLGEESLYKLINYKGNLAVIYWEEDDVDDDAGINKLHMWVLEDVEKKKWLKYAYTLSDDKFFRSHVSVTGVTVSGEIVFSMSGYTPNQPYYVFYFSPEKNNLQRVEIQGFGETFTNLCHVYTFVDHIEDLNVNDPKLLKSVHTLEWKKIEMITGLR